MSKKKTAKDVMLAHSKAKVDFYQNYLERYLSVFSVTKFFNTINIFDVFCGRGEYANGGLGSPIRAVQTIERIKKNRPSNLKINLFLNDAEKEYVNNVQKYIEAHFPCIQQYCNICYLNAKVDNLFNALCKILPQTAYNERNFLFIDPYGYKDINRDIFSQMMSNGKTEIILFLPISFMHRFRNYAFHHDAHNSAKPLRNFICQFFPANHPVCCDEEMDVLEYIDALKEAFTFNGTYYTTSYFIERNTHDYFALFFLCNNLLGLEKAIETKWALDEDGGKGFHQQKDDCQLRLFIDWDRQEQARKHFEYLRTKLIEYISIKDRSNADIYEYTLCLGYKPTHSKEVLQDLQNNHLINVLLYASGEHARKNSFYINYSDAKDKHSPKVLISLVK